MGCLYRFYYIIWMFANVLTCLHHVLFLLQVTMSDSDLPFLDASPPSLSSAPPKLNTPFHPANTVPPFELAPPASTPPVHLGHQHYDWLIWVVVLVLIVAALFAWVAFRPCKKWLLATFNPVVRGYVRHSEQPGAWYFMHLKKKKKKKKKKQVTTYVCS